MVRRIDHYLTQLLQIHWLRPETALWRSFDCLLMEKYGAIAGEAVDLGCGDGTMSFIMAGGTIENYDVFMNVGQLQDYNKGADIHNQISDIPIDSDSSGLRHRFEWGIDHKAGLINKAKKFSSLYKNNLVFDLNDRKLPFSDGAFDSAFSNILYWLNDIDNTLVEWRRILRDRGKLFVFVPNSNFKEKAWLYYSAPHVGDRRYLNYFDRGYGALIHHCYSTSEWCDLFQRNGFSVSDHHLYLTNPIMDVWNIGTRPIAPLLIRTANALSSDKRLVARSEWIDYFMRFFTPMIDGEFERRVSEGDAAFHFFVLERT